MKARVMDGLFVAACVAMPAVALIAAAWILSPPPPERAVAPFNWSQQTLRSPGELECRAQHRIPEYADEVTIGCLPERTE